MYGFDLINSRSSSIWYVCHGYCRYWHQLSHWNQFIWFMMDLSKRDGIIFIRFAWVCLCILRRRSNRRHKLARLLKNVKLPFARIDYKITKKAGIVKLKLIFASYLIVMYMLIDLTIDNISIKFIHSSNNCPLNNYV